MLIKGLAYLLQIKIIQGILVINSSLVTILFLNYVIIQLNYFKSLPAECIYIKGLAYLLHIH